MLISVLFQLIYHTESEKEKKRKHCKNKQRKRKEKRKAQQPTAHTRTIY
jgi:hypothetical protein